MATMQSAPSGITKLTKLLQHLNGPPRLTFTKSIKSLRLTLAFQNDHFGARHFVKEDLPRIRHHNPDLEIGVIKWRKEKNDLWRPELEVEFDDGRVTVVDMYDKPSSIILKEVMCIAGGDPWKKHVEEAEKVGTPIIVGETRHDNPAKKSLPNLSEFRKANVKKEEKAELARKERMERKAQKKRGDVGKREMKTEESSDMSASGVLPPIPEMTPSTLPTAATS